MGKSIHRRFCQEHSVNRQIEMQEKMNNHMFTQYVESIVGYRQATKKKVYFKLKMTIEHTVARSTVSQ